MGVNIYTEKGKVRFKSAKYQWCAPGYVPLKIDDENAHLPLAMYAKRVAPDHPEFADDVMQMLSLRGFHIEPRESLLFQSVFAPMMAELHPKKFDNLQKEMPDRVAKMEPGEAWLWYRAITRRLYEFLETD